MLNKIDKFRAFVSYVNKDKISTVIGLIVILGFVFTVFDIFYFQSKFEPFTHCFYYYIIPISLLITIARVVVLIRRFKKKS